MADFGIDLSATTGLDPAFTLVSGDRILAEAALRRLTTQRGSLFYAPDYGTDVRELLLGKMDVRRLADWRARIEAEIRKDDRISSVRASLVFDPQRATVTVRVAGEGADGPFRFTLAVSAVSVELLREG
jgi:hypothetical protein